MTQTYLLRFGELTLKKNNRSRFEKALIRSVKRRFPGQKVQARHKKMLLTTDLPEESVYVRLQTVFGITGAGPIFRTTHEPEKILEKAWEIMKGHANSGKSFAVRVRRNWKKYPISSMDFQKQVGSHLLQNGLGLGVNLKQPDVALNISIEFQDTWLWTNVWPGRGGLPQVGDSKHLLLLSGGIDSPVAGHLIQKRGGTLSAIYFHTPPYTVEDAKQKVIDLSHVLARYQNQVDLYIVNFTATMKTLLAECNPDYSVVLSRRMMMRVAQKVCEEQRIHALVTGENLGQVASQTIQNMALINEDVAYPILRPLVAFDKLEIVNIAKEIGAYDISIRPAQDCCSLFSPEKPVTKGSKKYVHTMESYLSLNEMVENAFESIEHMRIEYPWG